MLFVNLSVKKSISRFTPFWKYFSTKNAVVGPYNFIDGKKENPTDSVGFVNVLNPATSFLLAKVAASGENEVDRAVCSSKAAFVSWSEVLVANT